MSDILPTVLGRGCDLYLAWNISVASGSDAQAAMALAIDNFSISGSLPAIPTANHYIYVEDRTGWDSLASMRGAPARYTAHGLDRPSSTSVRLTA